MTDPPTLCDSCRQGSHLCTGTLLVWHGFPQGFTDEPCTCPCDRQEGLW